MNPAVARRAELWIAGIVAAVGLWGLVLARDVSLTSDRGARIADSVEFSPFGALVTIALALLAGAAPPPAPSASCSPPGLPSASLPWSSSWFWVMRRTGSGPGDRMCRCC